MMVRPMKQRGVDEVRRCLQRLRSLRALGRIREADFEYIESHLDLAEQRILNMTEYDALGREVED
jgi:hypothetical protein